MTKAKERKIKLALMIGFAVVSTASLAVSSFAWFTSSRTATVNFTQLVVDAGLEFTFYAYKDNFKDPANDDYTVTGYQASSLDHGFDQDFVEITQSSWTTFQGMYPGDKLTFAIEVKGISTTGIALDVVRFDSGRSPSLFAEINSANVPIEFAWAIDVFGEASAEPSYYTKFVQGYQYENDQEDHPVPLEDAMEAGGFNFGESISDTAANRHFNILESTRISDNKTYLFYTICFSNGPGTFMSLKTGSTTVYVPNEEGNSNCYKGLGYQIKELSIREVSA